MYVNFLFNKFLSKILYFNTQKQNSLEAYFTSKIRIPNELPAVSKRVRTAVNKLRGHSEVPPVESKAMAEKSNANKITRVKKTKIEKKTDDGDNNITGAARLSLVSTKLVTRKTGGRDEFIPQRERDREDALKRRAEAVGILKSRKRKAINKKDAKPIKSAVSIKSAVGDGANLSETSSEEC